MAFLTVREAAAASAVGTDLMDGQRLQTHPLPRRVMKLGLSGSTAIGDCAVDLFYGSEFIARIYNVSTNAALTGEQMYDNPGVLVCSPNEPIHAFIADVGVGSVMVLHLAIEEIPVQRRRY